MRFDSSNVGLNGTCLPIVSFINFHLVWNSDLLFRSWILNFLH